jgi:hypothetical protein
LWSDQDIAGPHRIINKRKLDIKKITILILWVPPFCGKSLVLKSTKIGLFTHIFGRNQNNILDELLIFKSSNITLSVLVYL